MFCLVSFWVVLKELVFPWGNEGSKTKPINTHWSVASLGYWQGMRGVRADRTSVRASLSGSRSILQCQECRSALLYVTVPLFVFSWEVRARVNVRRGCPSRLSLGPVQGARVQLTLAIHRLVSAGEGVATNSSAQVLWAEMAAQLFRPTTTPPFVRKSLPLGHLGSPLSNCAITGKCASVPHVSKLRIRIGLTP